MAPHELSEAGNSAAVPVGAAGRVPAGIKAVHTAPPTLF